MAQLEETQDLAEYFYAVGRSAARCMKAKSDLAIYQECASVPQVDILRVSTPPKTVASDGTNTVSLTQKEESAATDLIHLAASCALPKTLQTLLPEPAHKPLSHETTAKVRNCQAASFVSRKTSAADLSPEPVSEQLNDETATKTLLRQHQTATFNHPNMFECLPFKPLTKPINDETAAVGERESIDQVWSNLSNCLETFVSDVQSAEVAICIRKLEIRLSEALKVISSTDVPCQSINVPFDDLIKVCDVFGTDGNSVWDSGQATLETANTILKGKTLLAMCSLETQEQMPSRASKEPLNHEDQIIVVHFRGCYSSSEVEDVEETLLATGMYVRDAETQKCTEIARATGGRVQAIVDCIRMQDACHFWAYVGTKWQQRLEELDAAYGECDVSDDELLGEDGGAVYLTKQPEKNDVLLMVAEDSLTNDFGVSAVRVRVIDVCRNQALLLCPDFATFCIQEWCLLRPCPKKMLQLPFQAKLCLIAGLVAKPSIAIVLKCCTLLLMLLPRWKFALKDATLTNFFTVFLSLSCGSIQALRRPALLCVCIGTTLTDSEKQSHLKFNNLVSKYVELVRKNTSKGNICKDVEEELRISTQTVRNLLFSYVELRKYFAQIGGFPIVMQLVLSKNLDSDLEMEVWKLLRVLFGAGDLCKENVTCNRTVNDVQKFPKEDIPERLTPKGPTPILPRKSIKHLLKEWKLAPLAAENGENNGRPADGTSRPVKCILSPCTTRGATTKSRNYLIRGIVFHLQPNDATLMLQQRKVNEIVNINTIQAVCGLLNSDNGGAIYFGIGPRNTVEGINIVRKQRDEIRIGFDSYFDNHLIPRMNPNACDLTYIKVFEPNEPKVLDHAQHTLYVIKLEIKVSSGMPYKLKSGQYFIIKDGEGKVATTQELREKIIRSTERQFR